MKLYDLMCMLEERYEYECDWGTVDITVHTGGNSWEHIIDVVFCPECKQFHIVSESNKEK